MTTQILASKYPEAHKALQHQGYVHIAALMRRYTTGAQMAHALGMATGSCSKWFNLLCAPHMRYEKAAELIIASGNKAVPAPEPELPLTPPTAMGEQLQKWKRAEEAAVVKTPPSVGQPVPDATPDVLMVSGTPEALAKAHKILIMLNCSVVEL